MSSIVSGTAAQYADSRRLAARGRLNREYTIAEIGWFSWVARQLPLDPGDRVLDIGCGPGWFWASVIGDVPGNLDLTLADQSAGMVEEAVNRCRTLPFGSVAGRQAEVTALPFDDGSFDAVIAMHMLYHVPDPVTGMAEMFRVLKPGGVLAVTTNGIGNMREIYELTTVFGSSPVDPGGAAFGYQKAEELMAAQFGNVTFSEHPARMRITEPEDVFLALTSYPPGDGASETQLAAFREAIAEAFERGGGVLEARKETGLFLSRKA
ncbi:class I SAM-dependent methyltransferase [Rhizobium sp. LC145]|uniref:class I SAM-dependent methyltransferase n=1 Tax=Rhizobium sp. LC145 TaxID=1120688 RepID=UPI00062A39ED|nr:class I SAM-dependent methyltransferase [Rhizobium sp. LC145]KKX30576.1 methyltransferase [Rhizobium sp. LC145]TKT59345.1 class I SAM-dependent methyltransferase [Rhizobiaceae bacterium LC148]